jgi:hypothetical protein
VAAARLEEGTMETLKQPPAGTMQIGVVYPQTELRGDPGAVRRIGKGAKDLGFDHIPSTPGNGCVSA